jgi:transposase
MMRSQSRVIKNEFSNFIGIDVSKDTVDIFSINDSLHMSIKNEEKSLIEKFSEFQDKNGTLVVLENTGGHENKCIKVLIDLGFKVHKTNNFKVNRFSQVEGGKSVTDKIASRNLALYGESRYEKLELYALPDCNIEKIKQLLLYQDSLIATRAIEKTRIQSPGCKMVEEFISRTISSLDEIIKENEKILDIMIDGNEEVKKNLNLLTEYVGIGRSTAIRIIFYIPEMGKIGKYAISALCGVAPHAKDSGKKHGYRTTKGDGRPRIRTLLFFSALAAIRHNEEIKKFYERLLANGKKKKVAIIACMRKMVVQLNGILKRGYAIR